MLHLVQRHPFAVEAFFERSLVLTYAVPSAVLTPLAGQGLELDTYDGWGFLAIAMVQTRSSVAFSPCAWRSKRPPSAP